MSCNSISIEFSGPALRPPQRYCSEPKACSSSNAHDNTHQAEIARKAFNLNLVRNRLSPAIIRTSVAAGIEMKTCQNMIVVGEIVKQKTAASMDSAIEILSHAR